MDYNDLGSALEAVLPLAYSAPVARWAVLSAIALAGATSLAVVSCVYETATFAVYKKVERLGLIERLVPKATTINAYQLATFKTFVASLWLPVLLYLVYAGPLIAAARPSWNPLAIIPQLWLLAVWHDFHFWAVHATLHKFKFLYRKIHVQHHDHPFADLHVFQTADMHFIEAFALTMGFYAALLLLSLHLFGSWNPVLFTAYVLLEANMNMGGHCGYDMPAWLQFLVTVGIGNTPWSASSKTHFIHHLDPSTNRALYFTWVDRAAGTFRATHPLIRERSPQEQSEYNWRPLRMARKVLLGA